MKFHKNTIIALAVLAVFVVCVSIAKVSLANPFSPKKNSPPAKEETASEAMGTNVDLGFSETFNTSSALDLHASAVQAHNSSMTPEQSMSRYMVLREGMNPTDTMAIFLETGTPPTQYIARLFKTRVADKSGDLTTLAYSFNIYNLTGTFYDSTVNPNPLITDQIRYLLTNNVPYKTAAEVNTALATAATGGTYTGPTTLTEDEIENDWFIRWL